MVPRSTSFPNWLLASRGHILPVSLWDFVILWEECFHDISVFAVPSDLTAEERQELENIRRRKQELLADIQVGGLGKLTTEEAWVVAESMCSRVRLQLCCHSSQQRIGISGYLRFPRKQSLRTALLLPELSFPADTTECSLRVAAALC